MVVLKLLVRAALIVILSGCATSPSELRPTGSPIAPSASTPSSAASPAPSTLAPPPSVQASPQADAATPAPSGTPGSSGIDVYGIAFVDVGHGLLVGADAFEQGVGTVWRTSDGGRSWSVARLGSGPLAAVAVVGPSDAWAAVSCAGLRMDAPASCRGALFGSADGGRSWHQIGDQQATSLSFVDANRGWAIGNGGAAPREASLLSTLDGGTSWRAHPNPCPKGTGSPVSVSFPDATHGWVACNFTAGAGEALKGIVATTDGGTSWQTRAAVRLPSDGPDVGSIGVSGYLAGIAIQRDGTGMNWQDRGISEKTTDGGRTWRGIPPGSFDAVEPEAGWIEADGAWLLYVWNGSPAGPALEVSHDRGASWQVASVIPAPAS